MENNPDLFPASEMDMLSPRLKWLKQHDLITKQQGYPFTAHPLSWCCSNRAMTVCGWGETELDSTIDYCNRYKVKHWTLSDGWSSSYNNPDNHNNEPPAEPL